MHSLESIIAELEKLNHKGRVHCLRELKAKLESCLCHMGKINNVIKVKDKEIAELKEQLKNTVPADADDVGALAGFDDAGNPIPPAPPVPTEEALTAQLKQSADALNTAVENQST